MNIQLNSEISITVINCSGNDRQIAMAAWVSTQMGDKTDEDVEKLIPYLMKHRHGSPFEHGSLTVNVHAPIFVWREWHRHRIGFSYNEESARYTTLKPVFYVPSEDRPMFKVENWKPGRPKFLTIDEYAMDLFKRPDVFWEYTECLNHVRNLYTSFVENKRIVYTTVYEDYLWGLEQMFDPGLARDSLPVGIYSSCWVTMNPRSLMSFLSLRQHHPDSRDVSYPLWEINMAANKLEEIFQHFWPITHKAFVENGRVAP